MQPEEITEPARQVDKALRVVQEYLRELVVQESLQRTKTQGTNRHRSATHGKRVMSRANGAKTGAKPYICKALNCGTYSVCKGLTWKRCLFELRA